MNGTATVKVEVADLPQVKDAMNQAVRYIERLSNERDDLRHLLQQWEQRVTCLQCGQRYSTRACGPTHGVIAHLVAGPSGGVVSVRSGGENAGGNGTMGQNVWLEWDEPGAGGIVIDGERVISFGIDTDWSDHWNPQVSEAGLRFMDALPRLVQERETAWQMYREAQAAGDFPIADTGAASGPQVQSERTSNG